MPRETDGVTQNAHPFHVPGARGWRGEESLDNQWGATNDFIEKSLGVASWTCGRAYEHLHGVAGDPISDGMELPLSFPHQTYNRGDEVHPMPGAFASFTMSDTSSGMIRNAVESGGKAVFMPCAFNAVSETDADPNNARTPLGRILAWLRRETSATGFEGEEEGFVTAIRGAIRPNPSAQGITLSFTVSDAAAARGPVRVEIFDVTGRRVILLLDAPLSAGDPDHVGSAFGGRGSRAGRDLLRPADGAGRRARGEAGADRIVSSPSGFCLPWTGGWRGLGSRVRPGEIRRA